MQILVAMSEMTRLETIMPLGLIIQQMTGGTLSLLVVFKNEKTQAAGDAFLAAVKKLLETADFQWQLHIRSGRLFEEIEAQINEGKYDLIIVGERFKNRLLQRLAASTAEEMASYLPCPVVIARGHPRPIHRVLLCEGGRAPLLLNLLIDQVPQLLAHVDELTVLHVMSQIAAGPGVPGWELRAAANELMEKHTPEGSLLEEGLARLEQLNVRPEAKVRHGLVVREILDEAHSGDYDLVVIGAHPATGWQHYLLDDLAREIIDKVDRPVLVIKR